MSNQTEAAKLRLAESLVDFVSEADSRLPRDQFLRLVINRIVDDLSAPLRPSGPARATALQLP